MAFSNGYTYRRTLTVDNTKVSGAGDLTNFPVLVKGTYAYLATVANAGKVEHASGYDIRFESTGDVKLDHEVVYWSPTTGEVVIWVEVPTLDGDADTSFYMYYGNSSVSSAEENPTGVWDTNYKGVWHMKEDPQGAIAMDGSVVTSQDTATNSFTVGNNANRLLIVEFASYQGGEQPSGITYNGDAMTQIVGQVGSYSECSSIWALVAPDVGTANVVLSGVGSYYSIGIISLYNCKQSNPTVTQVATGESTTPSLSITPTVDNCWIVDSLESEANPAMTTTSGVNDWEDEGESYQHGSGSHFVQTTAGAKTMSYSLSYGSRWNLCAMAVEPYQIQDSTSNGYDMTMAGAMTSSDLVTGQIYKAIDFDGTNDEAKNTAWASVIDENDAFTIEHWFNISSTPNSQMVAWGEAGGSNLCSTGTYGNNIGFLGYANDHVVSAAPYDDGNWHHLVVTHNGSTVKVIIDGTEVLSESMTMGTNAGQDLYFARWKDGGFYPAKLEEIRISTGARSNDWAITTYETSKNPSTFYAVGTETTSGGGGGTPNLRMLMGMGT